MRTDRSPRPAQNEEVKKSMTSFDLSFPGTLSSPSVLSTSSAPSSASSSSSATDYFEKMNPFPYASVVMHVKDGGSWKTFPAPVIGFCICRRPVKSPEEWALCYGSHLHKYECPYYPCRLTFPTQEAANTHYAQDHDPSTQPATIRCNQCGDVVESYEDLNAHEHRHTKELNNMYIFFNCDRCDDRYITAQNFIEHLARHRNVTLRNVEIDKSIPSLALPKDIQELRKEQERVFAAGALSSSPSLLSPMGMPTLPTIPLTTDHTYR